MKITLSGIDEISADDLIPRRLFLMEKGNSLSLRARSFGLFLTQFMINPAEI